MHQLRDNPLFGRPPSIADELQDEDDTRHPYGETISETACPFVHSVPLFEPSSILDESERGQTSQNTKDSDPKRKDCCPCFFTRQTALATVFLTIFAISLILAVTDLTILEENRISRDLLSRELQNYTYVMNGTNSDKMLVFEEIPHRGQLKHLELDNVEVNPEMLFRQLVYSGMVETVRLINVTWFGTIAHHDIIMPNLKEFILEINQQIGPTQLLRLKNRNCSISLGNIFVYEHFPNFQDKSCLRSLLFFYKPISNNLNYDWDITQVHRLGVKIDITILGMRLFRIDPSKGEVISMLDYSNEILQNIQDNSAGFGLKELHLIPTSNGTDDGAINLSTLEAFSNQLTHLTLGEVILVKDNSIRYPELPANFLGQFTLLEHLFLGKYISSDDDKLQRIELNSLSTNLRQLSFEGIELELDELKGIPTFNNLSTIQFTDVRIDNPTIIHKFSEIFKSVKSFHWYPSTQIRLGLTFSRFKLWQNVMKVNSLEWIVIGSLFGLDLIPPKNNSTQDGKAEAEALLRRLNLQDKIDLSKQFIMKRNPATGTWDGAGIDEFAEYYSLLQQFNKLDINVNPFMKNAYAIHIPVERNRKRAFCSDVWSIKNFQTDRHRGKLDKHDRPPTNMVVW